MKLFILFSLVLTATACSGKYSKEQLQQWITNKKNGLVEVVENENFKMEVQYKPQNYLVVLEHRDKKLTEEEFKKQLTAKEELQYFNIKLMSKTGKTLLKTDLESSQEEDLRLEYYIGAFEQDIWLADGQDTIPCVLYHFERTYGALPFHNISVAFENKNHNTKDKTFLIVDRALGFGMQTFTFDKKDIINVPQLKFN